MKKSLQPLHGIRQTSDGTWEVWSVVLQFAISCGSPSDAKRVAAALEQVYPRGGPVDYSAVDAAIDIAPSNFTTAKVRLH